MLQRSEALALAIEWLDAWNSHDVDRVVEHFSADVVVQSPLAAQRVAGSNGTLHGRQAVLDYYRSGVAMTPELHFSLVEVCVGVEEVAIIYRNQMDLLVVEAMHLGDDGLVRDVFVSHGERPSREGTSFNE